jgi:hypothetical protein
MTFGRTKNPFKFTYFINNNSISSVNCSVRGLGFILTPTLNPNLHIDNICCKGLKTLGFIMRISAFFKLSTPLKALYCELVRPILEYGSVLWDPNSVSASLQLEKVQRKFLRFVSYVQNIDCPLHNYAPVLSHLNLSSLADRRHAANLLFLQNLLNGKIDSSSLLIQLNFKAPSRLMRHSVPFHIPTTQTNYSVNQPFRCMQKAYSDPFFSFYR